MCQFIYFYIYNNQVQFKLQNIYDITVSFALQRYYEILVIDVDKRGETEIPNDLWCMLKCIIYNKR